MLPVRDKHSIFNRSVFWSVFLFSIALVVPWVLAESFPSPSVSKTSSSTPSPQSESIVPPPSNQLLVEQQRQQQLASNNVSEQLNPDRTPHPTASHSSDPKTDTKIPQSPSNQPQTKTPPSKSIKPQPNTSQTPKPTPKTQVSNSSKPNKQQQHNSHSSKKSKAKAAHSSHTTPVIEMRVAIADGENSLIVATSTPAQVINARNKVLGKLPANEATIVEPNGGNLRINKWETPAGVWVKPTNGGLIFVGERWYRGNLLLVSQGNTVLAVNYVDLESYIASVVGSEVSASWPMDALKSQAIAARSYALVHYLRPANPLYDLGNTQRWQVYAGINSEWNTTRQATEETKGVFLSYKGGVVESMYAANDEIVSNVHGGNGMSQNGALSMAQQGYNYQQILGRYYPGASLAWIAPQASNTNR